LNKKNISPKFLYKHYYTKVI